MGWEKGVLINAGGVVAAPPHYLPLVGPCKGVRVVGSLLPGCQPRIEWGVRGVSPWPKKKNRRVLLSYSRGGPSLPERRALLTREADPPYSRGGPTSTRSKDLFRPPPAPSCLRGPPHTFPPPVGPLHYPPPWSPLDYPPPWALLTTRPELPLLTRPGLPLLTRPAAYPVSFRS